MASKPLLEADIQKRILEWLNDCPDVWAVKYPGSVHGTRGTPDILGACMGTFFAMEVKRDSGTPTAQQAATMKRIEGKGAIVGVVHSLDEARRMIDLIRGCEMSVRASQCYMPACRHRKSSLPQPKQAPVITVQGGR